MSVSHLIDWPKALLCAHSAISRPEETAYAVKAVVADGPCFQNKDFPLSPVPLLIKAEVAERLRPALSGYVELLGKVVRLYRTDADVRSWYGLDAVADTLIEADSALGDAPWVCRLDGYLEQGTERLRILENNADSPAGTLFTPRINDAVRTVTGTVPGGNWPLAPLTYTEPDRFVRALRDAATATASADPGKCADPSHIAVLQPAGSPNRESVELVEQLLAGGLDAYLADPRDLKIDRDGARFAGRPAELCWNKINTVAWRGFCADGFVRQWAAALRDTSMVHVNPFGSRYVAENKLTLAFVQEPRFASLFTDQERELVTALLPWSRKLTEDALDEAGGPLVDRLLADPREFVLKQAYDIRGDGVSIGYDCPPDEWRSAIAEAMRSGHVVQRRVLPTHYPVVAAGTAQVHSMAISMDTYLFGSEVVGFGSKASNNSKINIFQGGQKLAVHVVSDGRS